MGRFSHLGWMLAVLLLLGAEAIAQEPIAWESNLERAQQTAAQTNRLVLVHFWAPWCGPCQRMDAEVFSQPEVARQIQANYVPVKINADQYPDIAKKFGVDGLPTDVVLTPQGQVVNVAKEKGRCGAVCRPIEPIGGGFPSTKCRCAWLPCLPVRRAQSPISRQCSRHAGVHAARIRRSFRRLL